MKKIVIKIATFIKVVIFLALLVVIFESVSRLLVFQGDQTKMRLAGFYEEPKDSIDVVLVGPSSIYPFFIAGLAWNDYGYTGYPFSTPGLSIPSIKYLIEEAERVQNPKLYVIDIRRALVHDETLTEAQIRRMTDNMQLAKPKLFVIRDLLPKEEDKIPYLFGIIKYHTRWKDLTDIDYNVLYRETDPNKGFYPYYETMLLSQEIYKEETQERSKISNDNEALLRGLFAYCEDKDINVLFTIAPWCVTKSKRQKGNYVKDMAKEYGFTVMDANDYYEEIGIDFDTDMYDKRHSNVFGAVKYTKFLSEYIKKMFPLEDKRNDAGYESWDKAYLNYLDLYQLMEQNKDIKKPAADIK